MIKRIVWGAVGLGVVALVVIRIVQASADTEPAPDVAAIRRATGVPVEVAAADVGPLVVRRRFTGSLRGIRSATIRARTGDEIVEIPVRVGQRVGAGQVVLRQSSEGSLSAVRQAEAACEQARRTVERLRPLHERGAISDQDWDTAVTGQRVAEANLAAARRSVELTSPIAGVVTDVLVTRGAMPSPGDPLVRVSDLSRVQVLVQVSGAQARELTVGQPARVAGADLEGRVSRVAMQADPDTRLLELELTFPGPTPSSAAAARVVPGTFAEVEVEIGRRDATLRVPAAAVVESAVWVVDSAGVARRRDVRPGLAGDGWIEILEGVAAGEQVVTAGASLLSDGVRARVVGRAAS